MNPLTVVSSAAIRPADLFWIYIIQPHPLDPAITRALRLDNPPRGRLYGRCEPPTGDRCPTCEKEAVKLSADTGLCYQCGTLAARLLTLHRIRQAERPAPPGTACGLCGLPSATVLPVTAARSSADAAGIYTDRAAWRLPASPWVCPPCAALYMATGARFGPIGSLAMWLDPTGRLGFRLREDVPWWEVPLPPAWCVHVRVRGGKTIYRWSLMEVSLDPRWVLVNVVDSAAMHPQIVCLPRLDAAERATVLATVHAMRRLPSGTERVWWTPERRAAADACVNALDPDGRRFTAAERREIIQHLRIAAQAEQPRPDDTD